MLVLGNDTFVRRFDTFGGRGVLDYSFRMGSRWQRTSDDSLAHNIRSITINAQGQVVVGTPSHSRILHHFDCDDQGDQDTLFSYRSAKGADKVCLDGRNIICEDCSFVWWLCDTNGSGRVDSPGYLVEARAKPDGSCLSR